MMYTLKDYRRSNGYRIIDEYIIGDLVSSYADIRESSLLSESNSIMTGIITNMPHIERRFMHYIGFDINRSTDESLCLKIFNDLISVFVDEWKSGIEIPYEDALYWKNEISKENNKYIRDFFKMDIGFKSAIAYAMTLRPKFIKFAIENKGRNIGSRIVTYMSYKINGDKNYSDILKLSSRNNVHSILYLDGLFEFDVVRSYLSTKRNSGVFELNKPVCTVSGHLSTRYFFHEKNDGGKIDVIGMVMDFYEYGVVSIRKGSLRVYGDDEIIVDRNSHLYGENETIDHIHRQLEDTGGVVTIFDREDSYVKESDFFLSTDSNHGNEHWDPFNGVWIDTVLLSNKYYMLTLSHDNIDTTLWQKVTGTTVDSFVTRKLVEKNINFLPLYLRTHVDIDFTIVEPTKDTEDEFLVWMERDESGDPIIMDMNDLYDASFNKNNKIMESIHGDYEITDINESYTNASVKAVVDGIIGHNTDNDIYKKNNIVVSKLKDLYNLYKSHNSLMPRFLYDFIQESSSVWCHEKMILNYSLLFSDLVSDRIFSHTGGYSSYKDPSVTVNIMTAMKTMTALDDIDKYIIDLIDLIDDLYHVRLSPIYNTVTIIHRNINSIVDKQCKILTQCFLSSMMDDNTLDKLCLEYGRNFERGLFPYTFDGNSDDGFVEDFLCVYNKMFPHIDPDEWNESVIDDEYKLISYFKLDTSSYNQCITRWVCHRSDIKFPDWLDKKIPGNTDRRGMVSYRTFYEESKPKKEKLNRDKPMFTDYPSSAKANAKKVLEWKRKYGSKVKGMLDVGWNRARQLAAGKPLSARDIGKISGFRRHKRNWELAKKNPKFKTEPWRIAGAVAWLGWGGDAIIQSWAPSKLEQIRKQYTLTSGSVNEASKHQKTVDVTWDEPLDGMILRDILTDVYTYIMPDLNIRKLRNFDYMARVFHAMCIHIPVNILKLKLGEHKMLCALYIASIRSKDEDKESIHITMNDYDKSIHLMDDSYFKHGRHLRQSQIEKIFYQITPYRIYDATSELLVMRKKGTIKIGGPSTVEDMQVDKPTKKITPRIHTRIKTDSRRHKIIYDINSLIVGDDRLAKHVEYGYDMKYSYNKLIDLHDDLVKISNRYRLRDIHKNQLEKYGIKYDEDVDNSIVNDLLVGLRPGGYINRTINENPDVDYSDVSFYDLSNSRRLHKWIKSKQYDAKSMSKSEVKDMVSKIRRVSYVLDIPIANSRDSAIIKKYGRLIEPTYLRTALMNSGYPPKSAMMIKDAEELIRALEQKNKRKLADEENKDKDKRNELINSIMEISRSDSKRKVLEKFSTSELEEILTQRTKRNKRNRLKSRLMFLRKTMYLSQNTAFDKVRHKTSIDSMSDSEITDEINELSPFATHEDLDASMIRAQDWMKKYRSLTGEQMSFIGFDSDLETLEQYARNTHKSALKTRNHITNSKRINNYIKEYGLEGMVDKATVVDLVNKSLKDAMSYLTDMRKKKSAITEYLNHINKEQFELYGSDPIGIDDVYDATNDKDTYELQLINARLKKEATARNETIKKLNNKINLLIDAAIEKGVDIPDIDAHERIIPQLKNAVDVLKLAFG